MKKNVLMLLMLASAVNVMSADQYNGVFAWLPELGNKFTQNYVYNGPASKKILLDMAKTEVLSSDNLSLIPTNYFDEDSIATKNLTTIINADYSNDKTAMTNLKKIRRDKKNNFFIDDQEIIKNGVLIGYQGLGTLQMDYVSKASSEAESAALKQSHQLTAVTCGAVAGCFAIGRLVAKEAVNNWHNNDIIKTSCSVNVWRVSISSSDGIKVVIAVGITAATAYLALKGLKLHAKKAYTTPPTKPEIEHEVDAI